VVHGEIDSFREVRQGQGVPRLGWFARVSAIAAWRSVRRSVDTFLPSTASATRCRSQVSKGSVGSGMGCVINWSLLRRRYPGGHFVGSDNPRYAFASSSAASGVASTTIGPRNACGHTSPTSPAAQTVAIGRNAPRRHAIQRVSALSFDCFPVRLSMAMRQTRMPATSGAVMGQARPE
jgi:hypothetical protein